MSEGRAEDPKGLGFETTVRGHIAPEVDATLPELKPGQIMLERYRLERRVGLGGMGTVWRAQDLKLNSNVAVKFTTRLDPVGLKRFADESLLAASLGSPHILRVFDVGAHEGMPFSVTEWLDGETLAELLLGSIRLSPQVTLSIVTQISRALTSVHEAGIVHRDLKPSNILLIENGDGYLAKLLDFGVARHKNSELTKKGDRVGTPEYMSPEQATDAHQVDGRSDLWALAIVTFECLTGRRPFEGKNWAGLLRKMAGGEHPLASDLVRLPPAFDQWFATAVSPDIGARFQRIDDYIVSLTAALTSSHLAASAKGAPSRAQSLAERTLGATNRTQKVLAPPVAGATSSTEGALMEGPLEVPKNGMGLLWFAGILILAFALFLFL